MKINRPLAFQDKKKSIKIKEKYYHYKSSDQLGILQKNFGLWKAALRGAQVEKSLFKANYRLVQINIIMEVLKYYNSTS